MMRTSSSTDINNFTFDALLISSTDRVENYEGFGATPFLPVT